MATQQDQLREPAPPPPPAASKAAQLIEFEEFIEAQLRKTRSHVRSVDISGSLMLLAAGSLAYFLVAALVDHWVVAGGLGYWGRALFLATYLVGAAIFVITQVAPLLFRSINPVYAAETIERSRPSLKNGLVNFLFFRANPAGMSAQVYEAVEEQAATRLAESHADAAVDRTRLIKVSYVLAGVLLLCALYTLVSPKDFLKSIGRIAMPWAEISAPTQTAIVEIEPRGAQAFRGQQVDVSARIQGLPDGGRVMLYYSTADGQIVDRAVEMVLAADGYKHACTLPAGDSSLQQSLEYRIEAGDAISPRFKLEVVAAPTIVVESVEYKYPAYTGLLAQRVEHQGDLKAIEGTQITIHALANAAIQSAQVDFDCDDQHDQRMQVEGDKATTVFRLKLKDDRQTPEHTSYRLVFKNEQGQQNPQPVRHEIEVTRDLSPEVQFVAPQKDDVDLPANAALELEVVAVDPDFALQRVKLSIVKGPKSVADKLLLDAVHRGQFVGRYLFEPAKLGLKPGDAVDYLAVAEDTKDGQPNRVETPRRRIRIVSPDPRAGSNDRVARNEPRDGGRQGNERGGPSDPSKASPRDEAGRDGDSPSDEPNADASRGGEQPKSAAGKKPSDPAEQPDQGDQQSPSEKGEAGKQQSSESGDQQQPGKSKQDPGDGQSGGEGQQGAGQQGAGKQGGKQASGDQKSQGSESGSESGNDQAGEGGESGGGQPGADGKGKSQENKSQQGQSQGGKSDSKSTGAKQDGGESSGEQPVASDGSNDGDAIDQILKHRDAQQGQRAGEKGQPSGDKSQQANDQQGDDQQGNEAAGQEKQEKSSGDKPGEPTPAGANDPRGKQQPSDSAQRSAKAGEEQSPDEQTGGDEKSSQGAGQQGKSAGKSKSQGDSQGERGQPSGDKGESDRGQSPANESGEPSADASGKPSGKQQDQPSKAGDAKQDPAGKAGEGEEQSGEPGSKAGAKGDKQSPSAKGEESPSGDQQDGAGENQKGAGEKAKGDPAGKPDQRGGNAEQNGSPDKSQPDGQSSQGQGAKSKSDPTKGSQNKSKDQQPDAKGGDSQHETGESGAGQKGGDKQGSPEAMESAKPKSKTPGASPDGEGKKSEEGQSGSRSQNESNSEGQDSGDQSGGGKQGGGQKANKPGTGGAGQNTAADEGAGVSDERGAGEDSERAGADKESQKPTGQSGDKAGQGSKTRASEGADGKPGAKGDSESAEQKQEGSQESPSGDRAGAPGGGTPRGGAPNGQSGDPPASGPWKPGEEVADEANLEYARKATDLALSHLKDELAKDTPDPNLLKRLGWTRGELEKFVERWEQMRDASKAPGEQGTAARRELDETLRSLGLRPRTTSLRATTTGDDKVRGMKESRRTTAPAEYAEQTKAYSQGTARGGK